MTVAFASLVAILIIERIDEKNGMISIVPLIMGAISTIVYWRQACFFFPLLALVLFFIL